MKYTYNKLGKLEHKSHLACVLVILGHGDQNAVHVEQQTNQRKHYENYSVHCHSFINANRMGFRH